MYLDDFLSKNKLKATFIKVLKCDEVEFIKKISSIIDENFKTNFLLPFDFFISEKKKYVGIINKNSINIREKTKFPKNYSPFCNIKIEFKFENDCLKVKTTIQGISYLKFLLNIVVLTILILISILLLFELEFVESIILLFAVLFYINFIFKKVKNNVEKVKKDLINYYKTC